MSIVSNITYLFRSYNSILGYMNAKEKYEKKVKLTNKSYTKLSERVHDSFATLHAEKRAYREEVSNIEEELATIKNEILNSDDKLERAKLKMEYNKKKIEHEVKLNLLPRKMKKVKKKMEKFIKKSRRPIMISEDLQDKISNISNMLAPILGEEVPVKGAAVASLNTENPIDISGIQTEFDQAMESKKEQSATGENMDSFISEMVDQQMSSDETAVTEEATDTESIGQNGLDLMPELSDENQEKQDSLDSMFGIDQENKARETVEIPQSRVVETPEIELSEEHSGKDEEIENEECFDKWNRLQIEFKEAAAKNDVTELIRIKEEIVKTAKEISKIETEKGKELEKAQQENSDAKKEKEESINAVAQAFAKDITSVINNGNSSIGRIDSFEEETAATMVSTQEIKSSTKAIKSILSEDGSIKSNVGDLNAMLSGDDSNTKVNASTDRKR